MGLPVRICISLGFSLLFAAGKAPPQRPPPKGSKAFKPAFEPRADDDDDDGFDMGMGFEDLQEQEEERKRKQKEELDKYYSPAKGKVFDFNPLTGDVGVPEGFEGEEIPDMGGLPGDGGFGFSSGRGGDGAKKRREREAPVDVEKPIDELEAAYVPTKEEVAALPLVMEPESVVRKRKAEARKYFEELANQADVFATKNGLLYKKHVDIRARRDFIMHLDMHPNIFEPIHTVYTPSADSVCAVTYQGMYLNGTVWDTSVKKSGEDIMEEAMLGSMIAGWQEGLQLMVAGDTWEFWIPPHLAYGDREYNGIPGGTSMNYNITLHHHRKKPPNEAEGFRFLAEMEEKEGIVKSHTGMSWEVIKAGNGTYHPKDDETLVQIWYTMALVNGDVVSAHMPNEKGDKEPLQIYPVEFEKHKLPKGIKDVLPYMVEGDEWHVFLPPTLGYGEEGLSPFVGAWASLAMKLILHKIKGARIETVETDDDEDYEL
eukprot:gnl/TRDRNA2_/TRDRNA2_43688_c0_seq1.p1 gnl/TRDRNA2_/TRDRNA2_43688_c0~~gnl/TRDRNA2_/TRDRNA2_43688_c0_seq1.p1  ORF type:complete len:485 (+),score=109.31 gnl/TRDRNA2_/TRDRNA2_43688_c0_seq1:139-1593(+)